MPGVNHNALIEIRNTAAAAAAAAAVDSEQNGCMLLSGQKTQPSATNPSCRPGTAVFIYHRSCCLPPPPPESDDGKILSMLIEVGDNDFDGGGVGCDDADECHDDVAGMIDMIICWWYMDDEDDDHSDDRWLLYYLRLWWWWLRMMILMRWRRDCACLVIPGTWYVARRKVLYFFISFLWWCGDVGRTEPNLRRKSKQRESILFLVYIYCCTCMRTSHVRTQIGGNAARDHEYLYNKNVWAIYIMSIAMQLSLPSDNIE